MNHEVTEEMNQYISGVTRHIPKNMRQDVSRELESLITDMLEKRCGNVVPTEHDIKVVLAELGGPFELAAKYGPERSLISGKYYYIYFLALKIVLICTAFGITLASIINQFSDKVVWYMVILKWFGNLWIAFWIAFGIVTFVFAIIEWAINAKHGNQNL